LVIVTNVLLQDDNRPDSDEIADDGSHWRWRRLPCCRQVLPLFTVPRGCKSEISSTRLGGRPNMVLKLVCHSWQSVAHSFQSAVNRFAVVVAMTMLPLDVAVVGTPGMQPSALPTSRGTLSINPELKSFLFVCVVIGSDRKSPPRRGPQTETAVRKFGFSVSIPLFRQMWRAGVRMGVKLGLTRRVCGNG